jgi:hypothetical protein
MDVEWIASEADSGRLSAEQRTSADAYASRLEALASLGEGYSEVSLAGQPHPHLALTFRGADAAVHKFSDDDGVSLLIGDGGLSDDQIVLLPGLEGDTEFSGAFVSSADHAIAVIVAFARSGSLAGLGEWREI